MKICAISDLHGYLPKIEEKGLECLFICGDILPLKTQSKYVKALEWIREIFIPWTKEIDAKKIYLVAGNHDKPFEYARMTLKNMLNGTNVTYLENESASYLDNDGKEWVIFGSPDCHIFGNWAFMYDEATEYVDFDGMPANCDILLTHDAAYGESDMTLQEVPWNSHEHIGNKELRKVLDERRKKKNAPKYHFFGHLHTCDHSLIDYDGVNTACVSLLDENYNTAYQPLILDIQKKDKKAKLFAVWTKRTCEKIITFLKMPLKGATWERKS